MKLAKSNLSYLIVYLCMTVALIACSFIQGNIYLSNFILTFAIEIMVFGAVAYVCANRIYGFKLKDIKPKKIALKSWLFITLLGVAICLINSGVTGAWQKLLSLVGINTTASEPLNFWYLLVFYAIVPAVFEEFVFRGILYDGLEGFSEDKKIVLTSALFALMHQNIFQVAPAFIIGLFLGYVFSVTKNIFAVMFLHFLNNFVSIGFTGFNMDSLLVKILLIVLVIVSFVVALLGLKKTTTQNVIGNNSDNLDSKQNATLDIEQDSTFKNNNIIDIKNEQNCGGENKICDNLDSNKDNNLDSKQVENGDIIVANDTKTKLKQNAFLYVNILLGVIVIIVDVALRIC
ncbi:MAG: type II CAAX endopeptidase family protein [Clostridia bacterium]